MLVQATPSPDFVNYLTFLLRTTQAPASIGFDATKYNVVRVAAAMNLKTKLHVAYSTVSPDSLAFIHSSSLLAMQDESSQIRGSAGSIISELVSQGGLLSWPTLLDELISLASNATGAIRVDTQEAAMSAIQKICEDNRKQLEKEVQGQRPLNVIVPKLMELTASHSPKIRASSLSTIHMFLAYKPESLIASLDTFLNRLFQISSDQDTDVRRTVCQAFVQLIDVAPAKLVPHMDGLVNYILMQQHGADDPELALDAAEFWLSAVDEKQLQQALLPYIPKIVPVLLQSMTYDENDAAVLAGEGDDAELEDKVEDLKPQFAQTKGSRALGTKPGEEKEPNGDEKAEGGGGGGGDELSEGEIEDDGDGDDFGDEDPEGEWSVRKCSAASLDVFANVYHHPVFETVLPYLRDNLRHATWTNREAAVLALGAIADGCMDSVIPHLPELVPYLISLLNDSIPVVRQITCWCLGRYSQWASDLEPGQKTQFFEPMMEGILHRMLDNNKKVQEAAATAFTSVEEKAGTNLIPYCTPILRQFVLCFQRYKDRNMDVLYNAVQTLADTVGQEIAKPGLVEILMPALIERWNKLSDQSRELFPLLECLGYVATAYGDAFASFAPPIFARCIKIIYDNIQEYLAAISQKTEDEPDRDFLIASLDLLSSIIQAIDPQKSSELVGASQPHLFELLCFCMQDTNPEVLLSAYALLGDSAINIFSRLKPYLPNIMPVLVKQLDMDRIRDDDSERGLNVINNACWSCGEVAVSEGSGMGQYLDSLYQALVAILSTERVPDSVNENSAITIGRLGIGCETQLAPHLAEFAEYYLRSMAKVEFSREKASSFLGFNRIVQQNPKAMESCLSDYFHAIALCPSKPPGTTEYDDLQQSFQQVGPTQPAQFSNGGACSLLLITCQQVLQGYKSLIPDFSAFLSSLPAPVSKKLQSTYSL